VSTADQFNRIVSLVAELTRKNRQGEDDCTLADLAGRFSTTPGQIEADLRTVTLLGEDPGADWLLSLSVTQEQDRVSIQSGGPFRRPLRFTGEELVALQLGLADEGGSSALNGELAGLLRAAERQAHALAGRGGLVSPVSTLVRQAITDRRRLEIRYTGEQSLAGVNRIVHPYHLIEDQGHTYLVAWCELAGGWRNFRFDRMLDALLADGHYTPREDIIPPGGSFQEPPEGATPVQVRFTPAIARWLTERHPDAVSQPDGSLVVTYLVASPEWLVRHVLQYGAEAEVIAPQSYRDLMRKELDDPR
jgi:proteasome accessory factor C